MRRPRAVLRRRGLAALTVAATTSLAGLLVSVAVARTCSVDETGRFAVATSALLLTGALARSAVAEPIITSRRAAVVPIALGRASWIGVVAAVVLVVAALVLRSDYLAVAGTAAHGWVVRECARAVLVARGRVRGACLSEGALALTTGVAAAGAMTGCWSGFTACCIWAAGGSALGYALAVGTRSDVRPGWRRTPVDSRQSLAFASDTLIGSGVVQIAGWIGAAVGGLSVAAALRGAGTLAGPVTVGLTAVRSVLLPRSTGAFRSDQPVRALARDAVLLTTAAAPPLIALALLPDRIGSAALGATWDLVAPILPVTAAELLFQLVASVPEAAHRAADARGRLVLLRSSAGVVRLLTVLVVAPMGVTAIVLTSLLVTAASAVAWWASLLSVRPRTVGERHPSTS
jgi:hypothetical protein